MIFTVAKERVGYGEGALSFPGVAECQGSRRNEKCELVALSEDQVLMIQT